jgi:Na+-driven multidrug efflux pump
MVLVSSGNLLFFSIVNLFGTNVIAAYTAASRINSFAIMPSMFFSSALTAFVGQNTGAGEFKRIRRGLYYTMLMTGSISIFFTIIALSLPGELMKLFTNEKEVILTGIDYFKKVSPFYIVFAMMFSYNALYRGTGNTLVPMYIAFVALWLIRFPAAILLSMNITFSPLKFLPVNHSNLWWSEPLGWTTGMLLATLYYLSNKWLRQAHKRAEIMRKTIS